MSFDTSGMSSNEADGYSKGYHCGYADGQYQAQTTTEVSIPISKNPEQCGVPVPELTVLETQGDREYLTPAGPAEYQRWAQAFRYGYMDGWYDGRGVSPAGEYWGSGPMAPPPVRPRFEKAEPEPWSPSAQFSPVMPYPMRPQEPEGAPEGGEAGSGDDGKTNGTPPSTSSAGAWVAVGALVLGSAALLWLLSTDKGAQR